MTSVRTLFQCDELKAKDRQLMSAMSGGGGAGASVEHLTSTPRQRRDDATSHHVMGAGAHSAPAERRKQPRRYNSRSALQPDDQVRVVGCVRWGTCCGMRVRY